MAILWCYFWSVWMSPLTHSLLACVYSCRWVGESLASGPQHLSGSETSQLPWRWWERVWVSALISWFDSIQAILYIYSFGNVSVKLISCQCDINCIITQLQHSWDSLFHFQAYLNNFVHYRLSLYTRKLKDSSSYHLKKLQNKITCWPVNQYWLKSHHGYFMLNWLSVYLI